MSTRGGELIAADESTAIAKSLFDATIVEDGQSGGCLASSAGTNESDWDEVLSEIDDLLDQLVASKEGPRWRGRGFSRCARSEYKINVSIGNLDRRPYLSL